MCLKNRECEKFFTLLLVVSHMGMKMTGSITANTVTAFSFSKNWGRRIKVVASYYSVNFLQNKKVIIIFHKWQINIWQK